MNIFASYLNIHTTHYIKKTNNSIKIIIVFYFEILGINGLAKHDYL